MLLSIAMKSASHERGDWATLCKVVGIPILVYMAVFSWQPAASAEDFDWGFERYEEMDYVPLDRVAEFYGMEGEVRPVGALIYLEKDNLSIEAGLDSRQMFINGVRHWLGFPVIQNNEGRAMVSRIDLVKTIEPSLRPERVAEVGDLATVILDAGHGGADKGAVNGKVFEKELNLDVCRKAKALLESKGFHVVMTRDSDVFISLEERAQIANKYDKAIFISVHFNDSPYGAKANGLEVFAISARATPSTDEDFLLASHLRHYPGNDYDTASVVLANCIQHATLGTMPQFDRGVKRARFAVLKLTRMPSVLVEGAFLSNDEDVDKAECEIWRGELAAAIMAAVVDYRRLAREKIAPKLFADYETDHGQGMVLSLPTELMMTQP